MRSARSPASAAGPSSCSSDCATEDDEGWVLHHHGGAVLLVARRQCAARCRYPDAARCRLASMDDASTEAVLRGFLRAAGTPGGSVRRLDAERSGNAPHQRREDLWLLADALHGSPARRLCARGPWRRSLLTSEVWHPHRAATGAPIGRRQRL